LEVDKAELYHYAALRILLKLQRYTGRRRHDTPHHSPHLLQSPRMPCTHRPTGTFPRPLLLHPYCVSAPRPSRISCHVSHASYPGPLRTAPNMQRFAVTEPGHWSCPRVAPHRPIPPPPRVSSSRPVGTPPLASDPHWQLLVSDTRRGTAHNSKRRVSHQVDPARHGILVRGCLCIDTPSCISGRARSESGWIQVASGPARIAPTRGMRLCPTT
jgi:hypothetical protein